MELEEEISVSVQYPQGWPNTKKTRDSTPIAIVLGHNPIFCLLSQLHESSIDAQKSKQALINTLEREN